MKDVVGLGSRVGSYTLRDVLGEGAMGVVFEAVHEGTGECVALKMLHAPRPNLVESIQREIRALAALDHPGVVRIVEYGMLDDCPWYAMERVEGVSLRDWLDVGGGDTRRQGLVQPASGLDETIELEDLMRMRAAGEVEERAVVEVADATVVDLEIQEEAMAEVARSQGDASNDDDEDGVRVGIPEADVLPLMEKICWALAFLHGRGLVHRDIKPSNIIIRPSGEPVLVDFGLVLRVVGRGGRENLNVVSKTAGTALYMAPEQVMSTDLDARADLYAFGCILYEALCGAPPFEGGSPLIVMVQHAQDTPRPLRARGCAVSSGLEDVVLRLLEKDRTKRPGYAQDVARALADLQHKAPHGKYTRGLRTYLYRPALVGRERERRTLERALETITQPGNRSGAVLCVRGSQGTGKTRLALDLVEQARAREVRVWSGAGEPSGTLLHGQAFGGLRAWVDAIADAAWAASTKRAHELLGREGSALASVIPSVQRVADRHSWPPVATLLPKEERVRLLNSLATLIESHTQGPTVLVLDDVQWMDSLTLEWLEMVLHAELCTRVPLLIVLVFRDTELRGTLRRVSEHPSVMELPIGPLAASDLAKVVGSMLSLESPPQALVRTIHAQSAGNPLYVAETLRCAAQIGALQRTQEGAWSLTGPLKGSRTAEAHDVFCALICEVIDALPERSRAVLHMCSVIGREIPLDLLRDVLPFALASEDWDAIEDSQLMVLDGVNQASFVYSMVRDAAYQSLLDEVCIGMHRTVAQSLSQRVEEDPRLEAVCAYHWFQAHAVDRALVHCASAARYARDHSSLSRAISLFEMYIEHTDEADPNMRTILSEGACALFDTGQYSESLEWARRALRFDGRNETTCELLFFASSALYELSRFGEAMTYAGRLEHEATREFWKAKAILLRSEITSSMRDLSAARALAERALETILSWRDDLDSPETLTLQARALSGLAGITFRMGSLHETCSYYERAVALYRAAGDRRREGVYLSNLASVHFRLGLFERAQELYTQALSIHRDAENLSHEASTLSNLASTRRMLKTQVGVESLYTRALNIHRATNNLRSQGVTLTNLATFHHDRGELALAFARFQEALTQHQRASNDTWQAYTQILVARLHRHRNQCERAHLALDHAQDILTDLQSTAYYDVIALCERGHIAMFEGNLSKAQELLRRAQRTIQEIDAPEQSPPRVSLRDLSEALGAVQTQPSSVVAGQVWDDVPDALRSVVWSIFDREE